MSTDQIQLGPRCIFRRPILLTTLQRIKVTVSAGGPFAIALLSEDESHRLDAGEFKLTATDLVACDHLYECRRGGPHVIVIENMTDQLFAGVLGYL